MFFGLSCVLLNFPPPLQTLVMSALSFAPFLRLRIRAHLPSSSSAILGPPGVSQLIPTLPEQRASPPPQSNHDPLAAAPSHQS